MLVYIWLFTNNASQCQGQSRDKQGWPLSFRVCPCLSLPVRSCPCLSLSVPVCPCLSLSVPLWLYICYTCISPPADNFHSLQHWLCLQKSLFKCIPMFIFFSFFLVFILFWYFFLNNFFIQSEPFYISDLFHKGLHLLCFKFPFFSVNQCRNLL